MGPITRRWLWLPSSLALVLLSGLALAAISNPLPGRSLTPARQAELIYLVRQDCGSCHGMTLRGGLGRPLLPETLADRDARVIAQIILDGVPGTPMPPWRGLLSETEALWIARRLKEGFPP